MQRHLPVEHQIDGAHRLPLRHQLRALRDDEARPLTKHPLDAGEELHDDLALIAIQALQERPLHRERRRIRDERADLPIRIAAPAQVAHHRRIGLSGQQRHRPRRLQHRGQGTRLRAASQVAMLGRVRDNHPLDALQHRDRGRAINQRVNVRDLRRHEPHEHVITGAQTRLVCGQVLDTIHPIQAQARERVRQIPGHRRRDMPRIVSDDQHVNRIPLAVSRAAHVRSRKHRGVLRRGPPRPPVGQPRPRAVSARAGHGLVHGHVTSPR